MKTHWITPAVLAACLAAPAAFPIAAHAATPPAAFQDRDDWQQPPDSYNDAQRQGFHEGIEAARRDWDRHRRRDADDHRAYKHPPVSHDMRGAYREGFRHGYQVGMRHMNGDHNNQENQQPY